MSDNEMSTPEIPDAIAIIGMACRFPGARNVQEFWHNLRNGIASITFFSDAELAWINPALRNDPAYVKARGIIEDAALFDAAFFGYTPRDAQLLDPQQRIFLECAWTALEDAGYDPGNYQRRIGIYAGTGMNTYLLNEHGIKEGFFQVAISNDKDFLTNRVAYKLNLRGPAVTVQSACSTSLVAVHLACQALLGGECEMALAGGVSLNIPQKAGYLYQEGGIFSPDGYCRAFDAQARGTVNGDGVGIVVLKRLEDALADRDAVYAVIKGSAINNDGELKVGFTAPGVAGQAAVIAEAQTVAQVEPESITMIEAHGTATPLGDPIEVAGLTRAFRRATQRKGFCAIGSVKTNVGHLDVAAGVAGLIKTTLALYHRQIPPSLHFTAPNPEIDFANSPFYVNTQLRDWPQERTPRRAGVSSFGIGGTNAHVVLEEIPIVEAAEDSRPWHLLLLSAKTEAALEAMSVQMGRYLKQHADLPLADVSYTLQIGRRSFAHRQMLVCQNIEDAREALETRDQRRVSCAIQKTGERPVAFLFPGQGVQHVQMAAELYHTEPIFRERVDHCCELLKPHLGFDLRTILYPSEEETEAASRQLAQTGTTQPALFVVEYALAELWMAWGIYPQAMIGHSIGEYVAACLAGTFSLEDALALVAVRGQMMQQLPEGAMLSVALSEQEVFPLLGSSLSLAAVNGPTRCVISGSQSAVDALEHQLRQKGVACQRLHTSHAFHSQMMDRIIEPFTEYMRKIALNSPRIPYVSNLTGTWITANQAMDPAYWVHHLRNTVRFAEGIAVLLQEPGRLLLEVGPGQTLSKLAQHAPQRDLGQVILSSLPDPQRRDSDLAFLLNSLGQLWLAGQPVNWLGFSRTWRHQRIHLPTYPFEQKRYWLESLQQDAPIDEKVKEESMSELRDVPLAPSGRLQKVVNLLRDLFASLLGIDPTHINPDATFLEMGADSLFLLQASTAIQSTFGVKIPFRQLLEEYATLNALATYMDERLPEDHFLEEAHAVSDIRRQGEPIDVSARPATSDEHIPASQSSRHQPMDVFDGFQNEKLNGHAGAPPSTSELGQIVTQQLQVMSQLMSQQLEVLRSNGLAHERTPVPSIQQAATPLSASPAQSSVVRTPPSSEEVTIDTSSLKSGVMPIGWENGKVAEKAGQSTRTLSQRIDPEAFVPYRPVHKDAKRNLSPQQERHLNALIERLGLRTQGSKQLAQKYRPFLADSRGTARFSLILKELVYPLIVERASGSRVWDVDGHEYIDLAMGFGSLLFGHSPSFIVEALEEQIRRGIRLGLQSDIAGRVAELVCKLTGMERVTFCNSGTEAVMTALRLARAVTGRSRIALFTGSYHGTFDGILAKGQETANGELRTIPMAPGVPQHMVDDVMMLHFDEPGTLTTLRKHANELAAVLLELPQSRRPDLQPDRFLQELRQLTRETGVALIFDEVVSGFRCHPGGAQALFGVQADLAVYGKALGGGVPVGAVAGKAAYMDAIDGGMWNYGDSSYPQATQTFFAGTYFRHPLFMPAILAVLNHLVQSGPQLQARLNQRTAHLVEKFNRYFEQEQAPLRAVHFSSLFRFVFPPELNALDANLFYCHLLEKGVHIPETRACFLSTAHTDDDLDHVFRAVKETVIELRAGGFLPYRDLPSFNARTQTPHQDRKVIDTFPLTEAQKELWFMAQMGDDTSRAYHESMTLHMRGPLNVAALRKALREVVNRHEALRTTFSLEDAYQRVASVLTIDLPLLDFSTIDASKREEQLHAWLTQEIQQSFDLEQGPLLRCHIVKMEDERHLLVFTYHHIIIDGWSAGILLREIGALYSAECQGLICQLPQPMPYSHYARWLADQQQGTEFLNAETYWLKQFAEPVPALELPTDRPRAAIQTYVGARASLIFDESLYSKLRSLSTQQHCTLFTTLVASFLAFLHRLTDQKDIAVAIPIAGQTAMDNAHVVGHCVNFLPLRSTLTGNPTFRDYLAAIKKNLLDVYTYQIYPFATLVKKLKLPRENRMPLVSTAFNLDYAGSPSFFGLEVEGITNPTGFVKLDLFLNIMQIEGKLQVECDYNTDLFDAQTIERWLGHLKTLIEGIVDDPEQRFSALSLLTATEQHHLLVEWNTTDRVLSQHGSVHELFEVQMQCTPDAVAVVCEDQHLSYQLLNQRANQLAYHLQGRGVGPETRVGIYVKRSLEMLVGLLGVLKAGGAYVPLDPNYPAERLSYMVSDAGIDVLLTQASLWAESPIGTARIICLDRDWPRIVQDGSVFPDNQLASPEQLAYVIYTSGSTGRPKGVQISHRALSNLLTSMQARPGLESSDIWLATTTLSFDIAALELFLPLITGARVVLFDQDLIGDSIQLAAQLRIMGATVMQATPTGWRLLLDGGWQGQPGLKMLCGGEALTHDLANSLLLRGGSLWNLYGPTETTIWSLLSHIQAGNGVSIGSPIACTQVYLLDSWLQPVPVGVPGALYLGGVGLARGYLYQPDQTAERFVPHPFSKEPGQRLYYTGDLARRLADGSLEYLGRQDHQVKLRGYRIEIGEVEMLLSQHPLIRAAVVVLHKKGSNLIAYLVPAREQERPSIPELRSFLKERLPEYMVPSVFVLLDALPLTANGKLDRRSLPAPGAQDLEQVASYMAPRSEVEQTLVALWQETLQLEQVGINDNFFELGGDSILSAQIVVKAGRQGLRFTPRQMFQHQTIAELSAVVDNAPAVQAQTPTKRSMRDPLQGLDEKLLRKLSSLTNGNAT